MLADANQGMHAPGPPRFTAVGEFVELAPREPDPDAREQYRWRLVDSPADSRAIVGDAVFEFLPDVAGTYRFELDSPESTYTQTVRAFPSELTETTLELPFDRLPVDPDELDSISVVGPFNDQLVGRDRPRRADDRFVLDVALPPGNHSYGFCLDDDLTRQIHDGITIPGPGRPRCRLDGDVVHKTVEKTATDAGDDVDTDGTDVDSDTAESGNDADDHGVDRELTTEPTLVVTANVSAAPDSAVDDAALSVEFLVDDRDAVADEAVTIDGRTLEIPLSAIAGRVRIHAVAVGERRSVADTLDVRLPAPPENREASTPDSTGARTEGATGAAGNTVGAGDTDNEPVVNYYHTNDPPAWAESPTVYEIFVRSFAGETLPATFEELERRLPYLSSLAIDVLWLTPVLASPTDHGYHITDYFSTAADLGDRAAFESLVDACHERNIRVVFDLVINHTSRDHPAFQFHSAGVPGYEAYYDRVPRERDATDVDWAGDDAPEFYFNWQRIPNLNYESLDVRRWMLDVVDEWADVVDGFRCDVAWGVSRGFWKEVRDRVPDDFLLLDETIPRDPLYHEAAFQMHYDTTLYGTLRDIGAGNAPAHDIFDAVDDARWQGFPESAAHLRYIENHDEPRYLDEYTEAALRAAAAATFTLPGAPMIYYGQERGMTDDRGPMKWYNGDSDLTEFHRSLSTARRDYPVLKTGDIEPLSVSVAFAGDSSANTDHADGLLVDAQQIGDDVEADETDTDTVDTTDPTGETDSTHPDDITIDDDPFHVAAFARENDEERVLVVLNFAEEPRTVRLPEAVEPVDLRTNSPLRMRYDPSDERAVYVVVDSVVICRSADPNEAW